MKHRLLKLVSLNLNFYCIPKSKFLLSICLMDSDAANYIYYFIVIFFLTKCIHIYNVNKVIIKVANISLLYDAVAIVITLQIISNRGFVAL